MFKSFKLEVLLLAICMILLFVSSSFAAEDKIGFMDIHRVLSSHPKYEATQKQLETFIQKKSDTTKAAIAKETDPKKKQEILDKARSDSGMEEVRLMNPLTEDINKVVAKVAKAKGVTVVVNKMLIYYGGVDLTDDVVKALKEQK